jgi:hypothetical protein
MRPCANSEGPLRGVAVKGEPPPPPPPPLETEEGEADAPGPTLAPSTFAPEGDDDEEEAIVAG